MKIAIIGSKGIPANYGGFETFAFHLAKKLSGKHLITVVNEKNNLALEFDFPVNILYSDWKKSKNPLRFYRQSLRMVAGTHDIILVCGVGGSLFYLFNKRKTVLVTNVDGLEHKRRKYSLLKRCFVFLLQRTANLLSDHLIADSDEVKKYWIERFQISEQKISAIAYGADVPVKFNDSVLVEFDLVSEQYYLVVGRLVPENNIEMIVNAFLNYTGNKKLVVVGNVNDTSFAKYISLKATKNIIFTDGIYDKEKLDSLRKHCYAYIHGHSVGGTNPALLEAMAVQCACVCHYNKFNREVTAETQMYFSSDSELLNSLLKLDVNPQLVSDFGKSAKDRVTLKYNWQGISNQYEEVFDKIIKVRRS